MSQTGKRKKWAAADKLRIVLAGCSPMWKCRSCAAGRGCLIKERVKRLDKLKQLYINYEEKLRSKRRTYRDLATAASSANAFLVNARENFARKRLDAAENELIRTQHESKKLRLQLAMAMSAVKAKGGPPADDRQGLQAQLQVLQEMEKVWNDEIMNLMQSGRGTSVSAVEIESSQDEIAEMSESARGLRRALDELTMELSFPDRISVCEQACVRLEP